MQNKNPKIAIPHYDFFVSGRWRNKDTILKLTYAIREKGYSVYCFLEASSNIDQSLNDPEEEMKKFERLDWQNDTSIKEIFQNDINAQRDCDTFVMVLPAGKSCHIEAGVAYGLGKKCILIGEQKEAESLYLIFDEVYKSEKEFLQTL